MIKKILLGLVALFVVSQFIRPERNVSGDESKAISTAYTVPEDVKAILKVACNDCHTNKTEYPWYANVQPAAWWLAEHVKDGKRRLNFSTFTQKRVAFQNHAFEDIVEQLDKKEMPISEYTYLGLHKEANLSDAQREIIINWAKAQMDTLKAHYPADSLKMPPRPKSLQPS